MFINYLPWLKLHRKYLYSDIYSDEAASRLFIHLLLTVSEKDAFCHGIPISIGSRAVSMENLGAELAWSRQKTIRVLDKLIESGAVTKSTTNKLTILTLGNWNTYQGNANEQNLTQSQQAVVTENTGHQKTALNSNNNNDLQIQEVDEADSQRTASGQPAGSQRTSDDGLLYKELRNKEKEIKRNTPPNPLEGESDADLFPSEEPETFIAATAEPLPAEPKPAKTRKASTKREATPRERDPWFDAIAEVSGMDPKVKGSQIAKAAREIEAMGRPPEDIYRFRDEVWAKWQKDPKFNAARFPNPWTISDQIHQLPEKPKLRTYEEAYADALKRREIEMARLDKLLGRV